MSKFVAEKTYRMSDENDNLIISYVVNKQDRTTALLAFEETKKLERLEIEVKPYKSKRSLEQNRLLWALLEKMAKAVSGVNTTITREECYCIMLEEAGVKYDYLLALPETENELRKSFRALRNMGIQREVNGKTLTMYQYFIGSSKFNTKEMTSLIEAVLDKLAELGVYDSEIELIRREYGV